MNREKFDEVVSLSFKTKSENESIFSFSTNPKATIFVGHFPNQPVLPGVVMIASVKKALEEVYGTAWRMESSSVIKYLGVIVPDSARQYELIVKHIPDGTNHVKVDAQIKDESTVYFKIKAVYQSS